MSTFADWHLTVLPLFGNLSNYHFDLFLQIMIFMSWKKLAEPKREESLQPRLTSGTTVDVSDEKSPLLDNGNPSM